MNHKTLTRAAVLATVLAVSANVVAAKAATVFVTNSADAGPGSFRAAIDLANVNAAITRIEFRRAVGTVFLTSTVWFKGGQDLTIDGNGATLDGSSIPLDLCTPTVPAALPVGATPIPVCADGMGDALLVTGGGDLTVAGLTVRSAPDEGIEVQVPSDTVGTVRVFLANVNIVNNRGFGVLVNDQVDSNTYEDSDEDPLPAPSGGSEASLEVSVVGSRFIHNGYLRDINGDIVSDRDGLRVNEGGRGDLTLAFKLSLAQGNAADGIEGDERGQGSVYLDMFSSSVTENGPWDPADLDDGFDVDESGDGDIVGRVALSSANDNFEEGFDFNENDGGDLKVDMYVVEASRNGEEGIDLEEDDDFAGGGHLVTTMEIIKANGNKDGDAGLKIREKGVGDLDVKLKLVEASNNLTGGISIREDAVGSLKSSITLATTLGNEGNGIDFDENSDGNVAVTVTRSNAANNEDAGVRADQGGIGAGTATLSQVVLTGNGEADGTAGNLLP